MKGLFIKDLMLLKGQKQFLLTVSILVIVFLVAYDSPIFVMSYFTVVLSFFGMSTAAFDDMDNGMAFLMTLPVTRKKYLKEKYFFSAAVSVAAWGIALILMVATSLIRRIPLVPEEIYLLSLAAISVGMLLLTIGLPIQLKFGSEKSRIASAILFGVIFLFCFFAGKLMAQTDINWNSQLEKLLDINRGLLTVVFVIIWMILSLISYLISQNILEKKEL